MNAALAINSLRAEIEAAFSAPIKSDDGPKSEHIDSIHRGHDGFIPIMRKHEDGSMATVTNIRADALSSMFPQFAEQLTKDAYYSVNGFAAPKNAREQAMTHAKVYKGDLIRYLCACYVDLDVYKSGLKPGAAIGQVFDAQFEGRIPAPSVYGVSGRGLWLYWALHDPESPNQPQRAWPEKVGLWHRVESAIRSRFNGLDPDHNASQVTQLTRIPGSINSKSGQPVRYIYSPNEDGRLPTYTLEELANWFGVKLTQALNGPKKKNKNKRRGWEALHAHRLEQFTFLRDVRGRFGVGTRHNALLLYAQLLLANKCTPYEAQGLLDELCSEFEQGSGADHVHPSAVGHALAYSRRNRTRRWRNEDIANNLEITPEESQALFGVFGEQAWPSADRFGVKREKVTAPKTASQVSPSLVRKKALLAIHQQNPNATLRERSDQLKAWGIEAAPATVMRDMKGLGIKTPEQREKAEQNALRIAQHSLELGHANGGAQSLVSSPLHNTSTYYVEPLSGATRNNPTQSLPEHTDNASRPNLVSSALHIGGVQGVQGVVRGSRVLGPAVLPASKPSPRARAFLSGLQTKVLKSACAPIEPSHLPEPTQPESEPSKSKSVKRSGSSRYR